MQYHQNKEWKRFSHRTERAIMGNHRLFTFGITGALLLWSVAFSYDPIADQAAVSGFIGDQTGVVAIRDGSGIEVFLLPSMESYRVSDEPNASGIYNPRISPDGNYVVVNAYYQGTDAHTQQHMIVRGIRPDNLEERYDLGIGYNPQWWTDPETGDLWIVYGTQDEQVLTTSYGGKTFRRKLVDFVPSGDPELLLDQAFKAGLSKDGQWLGTANKTPMLYDRTSDSLHILTSGSTCYQVMNPTTEPSRMDQILYFNSFHDSIVVKNSADEVAWAVAQSEIEDQLPNYEFKKFHVGGWSNYEEYILTGLLVDNGYDLLLIKKSDKSCLLLCRGDQHDMWLDGAPSPVADPVLPLNSRSPAGITVSRSLVGLSSASGRAMSSGYSVLGARIESSVNAPTLLLRTKSSEKGRDLQ